jgi:PIN domain nuclease of toxin-antitoxin system
LTLLDTHVWLWWLSDPRALSEPARHRIAEAEREAAVAVSAISAWEAAMLVTKGRLELSMAIDDLITHCERLPVMRFLPITARIATASVHLERLHADPADRLIVATARTYNATLVTKDDRLRRLDAVRTVW